MKKIKLEELPLYDRVLIEGLIKHGIVVFSKKPIKRKKNNKKRK